MAQVPVVVTKYEFRKPPILSEADFKSFKQIFNIEPTHDMAPKTNFWDEFPLVRLSLIIIVVGFLLGLISDVLLLIPALTFVILLFSMVTGTAESMWSYQRFLDSKNKYYEGLKSAIISSQDYFEFVEKAKRL